MWLFFALVRRGVRQAASLNRVVSIAKTVPIVVFVLLCLTVFDPTVFAANWAGGPDALPLFEQVRATMLVTVFVFIGVEGASVNSRHARNRKDVGRATLLGFLSVLAAAVGEWGAMLVGVALIVAVLGAYLAWTLMAAKVLLAAARAGDLPRFLRRVDRRDTPVGALLLTTALVQAMLVVVLFAQDAFDVALALTSSLILVPFLLSAAFALKLELTGPRTAGGLVVALLATLYTAFLLYAAGPAYLLLSALIIVPGTVLYVIARRQGRMRVFTIAEAIVFVLAAAAAVAAVVLLATGVISI